MGFCKKRKKGEIIMAVTKGMEIALYKEAALQAAKELLYPLIEIERIKKASSNNEITRIMRTCREKYL